LLQKCGADSFSGDLKKWAKQATLPLPSRERLEGDFTKAPTGAIRDRFSM
jgi:hypothetical protein